MTSSPRHVFFALAATSLAAGIFFAFAHPLCPRFALVLFLCAASSFAWCPGLGLLALPTLLPVLDFAPWSGGLIVDEFDLLTLAVLAGGYFRIGRDSFVLRHLKLAGWLALVAVCLIGWSMAGASTWNSAGFTGCASSMNAWRVGKSLLWVALLSPLLSAFIAAKMLTRFFWATLLGSVWVVLAIVWERAFFPGLLDFRTPYRVVGLFWEMRHGGAALDIYLALLAPLLPWAWRQTLPSGARPLLAAFILAFVYAGLTSFSRGLVCAASGAVVLHGLLYWRQTHGKHAPQIRLASLLIIALVGAETLLVFSADSFMNSRLRETTRDFGGRLEHWRLALGAAQTPTDWLFGIGLGKFPSPQVQRELGVALAGEFAMVEFADGTRGAKLSGPDALLKGVLPGRYFALSQRIGLVPDATLYRFSIKARSARRGRMVARICASHLLYPSRCSARTLNFQGGEWREQTILFSARDLRAESGWRAIGHGVFMLSVLTPGAAIEISELRLEAGGVDLLANSRFDASQGRWFTQSFHYFLPWHIDNLYLELLVETGALGLLAFLCVVFRVCRRLFQASLAEETGAIERLSCVAGVLALGLIVSVLDMPRVATLAGLFLALGWARISGSQPLFRVGRDGVQHQDFAP
ncbi:MAG: hypothetical protein LBU43_09175 [Candidatus Accumulibacter sp.]|jgi:hypothetical protein|nr:hypothetical protein [Accumulibacter sp.]